MNPMKPIGCAVCAAVALSAAALPALAQDAPTREEMWRAIQRQQAVIEELRRKVEAQEAQIAETDGKIEATADTIESAMAGAGTGGGWWADT